ncbi:MAG TPA: hypothetical protein DD671_15780, partial [Balneolaceae bacterium]|nr:hypothetical protein [Balneolaceae bacterium]
MMIKNTKKKFEILSLFSGGGFLDIGFINQGFEVSEAVEVEQSFIDAYNYAIDGYVDYLNSTNSNKWKIKHHEISEPIDASNPKQQKRLANEHKGITGIIGGPPCQDFSNAGKNAGVKGERGKLINSYYKIVKKIEPEFLFFENVDGLITNKKHSKAFLSLVRRISALGYRVYYDVLNSMEYGIPQDRDRLTLVAFKREIIDTLKKDGFKDIRNKKKLKYSGNEDFIFKWPEIVCESPKDQNWPGEWSFGKKASKDPLQNIPK